MQSKNNAIQCDACGVLLTEDTMCVDEDGVLTCGTCDEQ